MEIEFVIFISLIIKYKKIFLFILETKWRRNSCTNKRRFFRETSGLATELSYIFTWNKKSNFFFIYIRFAKEVRLC